MAQYGMWGGWFSEATLQKLTVSLNAALPPQPASTPAGVLRSIGKVLGATTTISSVSSRVVTRLVTLTSVLAVASALTRGVDKALLALVSMGVSLGRGAARTLAFASSLTTGTALGRGATHGLPGAGLAPRGGLGRATARGLASAALSPRAALTRGLTAPLLTATLLGAASLGRRTRRGLAGVITGLGVNPARAISHGLTAPLLAVPALTRATARTLTSGAVLAAGALSRGRYQALAATLTTASVGITRGISHGVNALLSVSTAQGRAITRGLYAALGSQARLTRGLYAAFSARIASTGAQVRLTTPLLAATLAGGATLARGTVHGLAVSLRVSSALTRGVSYLVGAILAGTVRMGVVPATKGGPIDGAVTTILTAARAGARAGVSALAVVSLGAAGNALTAIARVGALALTFTTTLLATSGATGRRPSSTGASVQAIPAAGQLGVIEIAPSDLNRKYTVSFANDLPTGTAIALIVAASATVRPPTSSPLTATPAPSFVAASLILDAQTVKVIVGDGTQLDNMIYRVSVKVQLNDTPMPSTITAYFDVVCRD